jgi:hypothetical protein
MYGTKRPVTAIDSRLRVRGPVFRGVRCAYENISNKMHLNQDIADFWCMMPPTPKVKGD